MFCQAIKTTAVLILVPHHSLACVDSVLTRRILDSLMNGADFLQQILERQVHHGRERVRGILNLVADVFAEARAATDTVGVCGAAEMRVRVDVLGVGG